MFNKTTLSQLNNEKKKKKIMELTILKLCFPASCIFFFT